MCTWGYLFRDFVVSEAHVRLKQLFAGGEAVGVHGHGLDAPAAAAVFVEHYRYRGIELVDSELF